MLTRRTFLALPSMPLLGAQLEITQPVVSEDACPLLPISPVAKDGYQGHGFLRKPPGPGPFPAIVWLHPGIITLRDRALTRFATGINASRFLAAGYVVIVPTYRSRDVNPQSPAPVQDAVAMGEYARGLSYIDPHSLVFYGCSGGGDLALQVATEADVSCVIAEEPASLLMAGVFNSDSPKRGERFTPADADPILEKPAKYYTPEYQRILRARIARIRCPILIIQGDEERSEVPINRFNAQVLLPELKAARKLVQVVTYPGEQHCFCFAGDGHAAAIRKAFSDMDAFCRKNIAIGPKPIDSTLVRQVAVN